MIKPDILIFQPFCIFILVISFYRTFQNSLSKIQAAVAVNVTAHQLVHPLLFQLAQISFSKIQFHIGVGFLKCLLGNHCDLVFYLALFLHIFSKGRILKICHPVRNLFHIVFQGILIHLFVEIVFPAEFRQFLSVTAITRSREPFFFSKSGSITVL